MATTSQTELTRDTQMKVVLASYPGAQRALFANYHIGGCQSCAFSPEETLAELCARNEDLPVDEVIGHIVESHDEDAQIRIAPADAAALDGAKFLDTRTREEHEAVAIPDSHFMSETLLQEIFGSWDKETTIIVYDHTGDRSMDAAAYLIGHGFANTRALEGGIDAYSKEVDKALPRYRIEVD